MREPSPIDVVIPYHPKDRETLPWCIEGVRSHVKAARILVVTGPEGRADAKKAGGTYVDENSVVPGVRSDHRKELRWGWYFQQLLKLGMADLVATDYYLVVDSDTVFLRQFDVFGPDGFPLYTPATEYHRPYFATFRKLFDFEPQREFSFIAHQMIFDRRIVREMLDRFRGATDWASAILKSVTLDNGELMPAAFSEYETYGHYLKETRPRELRIRPLRWLNLQFGPSRYFLGRLQRTLDYCSLHEHTRRPRPSSLYRLLIYFIRREKYLLSIK